MESVFYKESEAQTVVDAVPVVQSVRSILPLENLLSGMVQESNQSLLVLENDGGKISRISFNPAFRSVRVEPIYNGLTDPVGLTRMEDGSLIVSERAPGRVVRIQGGNREVLLEGLDDPSSVRIADSGDIIIAETGGGRILSYDLSARTKTVLREDRRFPSDAFQVDQTLIISELFERQGTFGQVVRIPISLSSFIGNIISWVNDSFIVDPTRLALDPVQPNTVLVSVRQLKRDLFDDTRYGALLRLDLLTGLRLNVVIDELLSPTEVIAVRDGYFVMEERSERIHFYPRNGRRQTIWEGLGEPETISAYPRMNNTYLVSETLPYPALVQIDVNGARRVYYDDFQLEERIGGILVDSQVYVSFPNQGRIDRIAPNGRREKYTSEIFSPGKMLQVQRDEIWVLDRLVNEVVVLRERDAAPLKRIPAENFYLTDFQVSVEPDGETQLYVMDRSGNIYRYQNSRQSFQLLASLPPVERSIRAGAGYPPVFSRVARVPGKGFFAALNDAEGRLYWAKENGDTIQLMSGYRDVMQLRYDEQKEELLVLSRRGWVRALSLEFFEEETPLPTPTPPVTSIIEWGIHDN